MKHSHSCNSFSLIILGCISHKFKLSCPNLSFLYHMEAISQGLFIKSCMYSWDSHQCNNYLSFRVDQSKLNKTLNFILSDDNTLCILNRESFFSRNRTMQFLLWEKKPKIKPFHGIFQHYVTTPFLSKNLWHFIKLQS